MSVVKKDKFTLYHGDWLEVAAELPDNSIDTIITDPPYGLTDKSPNRLRDSLLGVLSDFVFPNLYKFYPDLIKEVNLAGIPLDGSELSNREIVKIAESWVTMPECAIDLDDGTKSREKEVCTSDIPASGDIPDPVLMYKADAEDGKFLGNYVLDLGNPLDLSGSNSLRSFHLEQFFGGFSMPITPVLFSGDNCLFSRLLLGSFPSQSDVVFLDNDSAGLALATPNIVALSGTINSFVLRFDVTKRTVELCTTGRTRKFDRCGYLGGAKLIRTLSATSSLPPEFQPIRVSLVDFPTDGAGEFHINVYLHKRWADKLSPILTKGGFMGKEWDHGVPGISSWQEALRVAKPGCTLLAFGGTRTFHRLACAIEDAGWELRDTIMWVYSQGFPKSADISKMIDKAAGVEREVVGQRDTAVGDGENGNDFLSRNSRKRIVNITIPATDAARQWDGWRTGLKPSWEPIIVAQKPIDGTYAQNALKWGVAGLNIDGGRIGAEERTYNGSGAQPHKLNNPGGTGIGYMDGSGRDLTFTASGRWPANLIHDGSDEVLALFPQTQSGDSDGFVGEYQANVYGRYAHNQIDPTTIYADSGSAARFYYCAKASPSDRGDDNTHPTVKPLALMEYLCTLTKTPTGGVVLDMFMGSGSTGVACMRTGRTFVGVEIEQKSFDIAYQRITNASGEEIIYTKKEQATGQLGLFATSGDNNDH